MVKSGPKSHVCAKGVYIYIYIYISKSVTKLIA